MRPDGTGPIALTPVPRLGPHNQTDRSVFSQTGEPGQSDGARTMAGPRACSTRQRIVELAAPVFNRQGYVGASMRDLIDATGLEKGGIYNHFGSKEQLALEAYDYAMSLRHRRPGPLAGRRHRRDRPPARA